MRGKLPAHAKAAAVSMMTLAIVSLAVDLFVIAWGVQSYAEDGGQLLTASVPLGARIPLEVFISIGGFLMLKCRAWGLALAASILLLIPFGTACWVIGIPVGAWCIVTLLSRDTKSSFS